MLKILYQVLLNAVFPPRCLICGLGDGRPLGRFVAEERHRTAPFFCEPCRKSFKRVVSPVCSQCGVPFVSREGRDHRCSTCLSEQRYFTRARAFGLYEGKLMEAVHRFKYGRRIALAGPLSALVRGAFLGFWRRGGIDLVVPVPLHVKRLRERGFNQAYLLARTWAKEEGLELDGLFLRRHRYTEPQTTLRRAARSRNIKGAFSLRHPGGAKGRKILLVDDVYTTGATVNECARVLIKAGARSVDVLTLARTA